MSKKNAKRKLPKAQKKRALAKARPAPSHDLGILSEHQHALGQGITALGKATDALVKRVERAAQDRDPSEAILDLSKAYYSEERDGGSCNIQCDICKLRSPGCNSFAKAGEVAQALGWVVTDTYDHCPACRKDTPLITSGRAALVVPPTLSTPDMIFVTRIRFLAEEFRDGVSPGSLVKNSVSSGRRSMLSDFAGRISYDHSILVQAVNELRNRQAIIPEEFDGEPIRHWIREVFSILKQEDVTE